MICGGRIMNKMFDFGFFGYFSYFRIGQLFGISSCIGPSTWGRSKWTWVAHSKQHWYSVNNDPPEDWFKLRKLPFNIHDIYIDFGKTKLPFAIDIAWARK